MEVTMLSCGEQSRRLARKQKYYYPEIQLRLKTTTTRCGHLLSKTHGRVAKQYPRAADVCIDRVVFGRAHGVAQRRR